MKCNDIKHLHVQQYEGLTLETIFERAKLVPGVLDRLPCEKEIVKLPKQYLINVIYTVVGEQFAVWVKAKIDERNAKVTSDKDMMINVDPDIAAAF